MKYMLIKELYDCFYTPPELSALRQEIEECHKALIEVLEKPERRLVLHIIDAKDRIAEDTSIDSFISGFELAWQLSMELNNYENERLVSCQTGRLGARFTRKEEEPKSYHHRRSIYRLSRPVCRRVAAGRNGRGNTRSAPNTRRNRSRANCCRG